MPERPDEQIRSRAPYPDFVPHDETYLNPPYDPNAAISVETCEHPWDSVHYVDDDGVDTVRCSRCNGVLAVHAVDHDYQPPA